MNSVNITGRVGADIELRYTPSGKAVCEVNLAVDDGFGENKKTAWIGVTIWGQTAETAKKYVSKGDLLGITGRLSQEEWDDKTTGKKQRKTKVVCTEMTLFPRRDKERQEAPYSQPQTGRQSHEQAKANAFQPQPDDDQDQIPF